MIVYFDADDTLWYTNVIYYEAYDRFTDWAHRSFGADPEEVIALVKQRDLERAKVKGFHRTGFAASMVATYEELCRKYEVEPSVKQAMEVYMIGESVHDHVPELNKHALRVLDDLAADFEVNVLTLGDRVVQSAKLYLTGVYRHIHRAHIVEEKQPEVYRRISAENPGSVHVMIGNSRKSDISPALRAGWHAIWLEGASSWEWDDQELEHQHDRLFVVAGLPEVPGVVRQIARETENAENMVG